MIDHELRKSVCLLRGSGFGIREISRRLGLSRNSVRSIIGSGGESERKPRKDRIAIDSEVLTDLYKRCSGFKERMHEILTGDGYKISYQTLTRRVRELELSKAETRCAYVEDVPGGEMQHDTSPYTLVVGGKRVKVVASLVYFRYSKVRYLKFYRSFTRFRMKCFLYEALMHFGFAAEKCIIDNTNLAVSGGTGRDAQMCLEMERFAEQFSFAFVAHEIKHSNRKAGNERSFWTVETNFFPGREFSSLEDLNLQAFEWATKILADRPLTKKKIIPSQAFEHEKAFLKKVWPHLPRPYQSHDRSTDQYGYAAFAANYYWVPGSSRRPVKILEYADSIVVYQDRKKIAEYALPPDLTRDQRFPERSGVSPYPNNIKKRSGPEESDLRSIGQEVGEYLDFALKSKGLKRHHFITKVHRLSRFAGKEAFLAAIIRAARYRVTDPGALERMMIYEMNAAGLEIQDPDINADYLNRQAFQDGQYSERPDLGLYDELYQGENSDG